MRKLLFAVTLCLSSLALAAEPELKPAQEEAKQGFTDGIEESLKTMNDRCGTKIAIKTDFENIKPDEWTNISLSSYCDQVVQVVSSMCNDRPAYKKAIAKKVTGISCLFSGVKPAEKKDESNDRTRRNVTFEKGSVVFRMFPEATNIQDRVKEVLEKALN